MASRIIMGHWLGLASGPGAWALSTQVQYASTPLSCAHGPAVNIVLSLIFAVIAATGGLLSHAAFRALETTPGAHLQRDPRLFVAQVSEWAAALFTLVILLQGAAALFLSGCQR
ncbi:MAG: hypothetical protein JWM36_3350 [Hyphomicrobiales bacterium]|nr:hypothetical protein [Hyphomicrobiales bacterium]